jgi:Dicarboxylate transport
MRTKRRVIIFCSIAFVLAIVVGARQFLVPWCESQLILALQAKGFTDVKLRVTSIGFRNIVIEDVSLGGKQPLKLDHLALNYSLTDLLHGNIKDITLDGVTLNGFEKDGEHGIYGLESLMKSSSSSSPFVIPVTRDMLSQIPVPAIMLKNSRFILDTAAVQATIPLDVEWRSTPNPTVHYSASAWDMTASQIHVNTGKVVAEIILNELKQRWEGNWGIDNIVITGAKQEIPSLSVKGTITAQTARMVVKGELTSEDQNYHAKFALFYHLDAPEKSKITLSDVRIPWSEGAIGLEKVTWPLAAKHDVDFTLILEHVSVASVLKTFAGEHAAGTGLVSGEVPVTITPQGKIRVHQGNLRAEAPGTIAIAPESLPGDNAQITLMRDVLKNLHYTTLSLALQSDAGDGDKLSLQLLVEGKNPDMQQGRPVKLHVHLSGDVLSLIQENIMAIRDPQTLLKGE